jgi:hypothetical protein
MTNNNNSDSIIQDTLTKFVMAVMADIVAFMICRYLDKHNAKQ